MRNRLPALLLVTLVGVLMVAAVTPTVFAAEKGVSIRDFAFGPRTIEVRVGDTVTWRNRHSIAHSATSRNGTFDTGPILGGRSDSVRFTVAGTYRYICTPHPSMTGTVIVRAASGGLTPPNTDMAVVVDGSSPDNSPLPGLAVVGGLALIVALRVLRRRRETA